MPRSRRVKSRSGCYHVILRGNEKKPIFYDDEDRLRFISTLQAKKKATGFYLYAFCLMSNHIHMMIGENGRDLSDVMKRIAVSYVSYFNHKHERIGHLFQDRFKSENVESDRYFLALARYIHQNPVKAGLVQRPADYMWSSYGCYLDEKHPFFSLVDTDMLLSLLGAGKEEAREEYIRFMNQSVEGDFFDINEPMNREEAVLLWEQLINEKGLVDNGDIFLYEQKLLALKEFKEKTKLPDKVIMEITGVSRYILKKAQKF
ncbi:transposase [Thermosyntropha sp.]|uniref:REP-associated tyrosine transposase n=1 Tax=Thermosyntropha sp. TaxID=2740820 RepID=UPI0025DA65F1|nr:transposase [Thermosyntropha sp.]MBO8159052.1 transposase [Thermosyntropha sp.]